MLLSFPITHLCEAGFSLTISNKITNYNRLNTEKRYCTCQGLPDGSISLGGSYCTGLGLVKSYVYSLKLFTGH